LLSDVADDAAEKIASANFRRVFNV
jgi:hypothetical protein